MTSASGVRKSVNVSRSFSDAAATQKMQAGAASPFGAVK
jgi:hypothetical protein